MSVQHSFLLLNECLGSKLDLTVRPIGPHQFLASI